VHSKEYLRLRFARNDNRIVLLVRKRFKGGECVAFDAAFKKILDLIVYFLDIARHDKPQLQHGIVNFAERIGL